MLFVTVEGSVPSQLSAGHIVNSKLFLQLWCPVKLNIFIGLVLNVNGKCIVTKSLATLLVRACALSVRRLLPLNQGRRIKWRT